MGIYYPVKFETATVHHSCYILFTSPVAEQKERNKKNNKAKTKDPHLHADLITNHLLRASYIVQYLVTGRVSFSTVMLYTAHD